MDLVVTSDTGPVGEVYRLASELQDAGADFAVATKSLPGALVICLRCLPESGGRRSFTRYEKTEPAMLVDVCVSEEAVGGRTAAQQRETLGELLRHWIGRASLSRSAPWSPGQRAELRRAAEQSLATLGWLDGPRTRAAELCRAGLPLDDIAEVTGLELDEVEDLFAATLRP
ncbi:hypothetical protein ABEU20_004088 [Rhodococcus sp. PAM 2766]|uniref:Uncharacterized protein n=1 Tax=Rhodococcus parequi TaxID=3137122 RepID=A0ABW9FJ00_9NOCA